MQSMQLVTLEDHVGFRPSPPSPLYRGLSEGSADPRSLGGRVPHFAWLANDEVVYDALGEGGHGNPGSAFGLMLPGMTEPSRMGCFTDRAGNTIALVMESFSGDNYNPFYKTMEEVGAFGRDPIYIDISRGEGGGFIERTIMPALRGEVMQKLASIESGGRQNRTIVVRVQGQPLTWRRLGELATAWIPTVIDLALQLGAPFIGKLVGASTAQISALRPLLVTLAAGEPADVMDIAKAVSLVAPADIQPYLPAAATFYQSWRSGDYAAAAALVGVGIGEVSGIVDGTGRTTAASTRGLQSNVWLIDTVNTVRARLRSGSVKQAVIDQGTMLKEVSLQNLLLAASTSIVSAVPRVQEIAGLAATETNDLQTPAEWRSLWQLAMGWPVTPGSIDRLALQGLIERAAAIRSAGGTTMTMPALVPDDKQRSWSEEILRQTGVSTSNFNTAALAIPVAAAIGYYFLTR